MKAEKDEPTGGKSKGGQNQKHIAPQAAIFPIHRIVLGVDDLGKGCRESKDLAAVGSPA